MASLHGVFPTSLTVFNLKCSAGIFKFCRLNPLEHFSLVKCSRGEDPWLVLLCVINHVVGYLHFSNVALCRISHHLCLKKPLKSLCCMEGRTPGRLHEAPQSPGGAPPLSWSPLRLFAQAVALKTAHSVWMFFSQARAAGYMFAFPPLSKATFTSGPAERKGSTVYESMQGRGGQRYFETKCPFGMCRQARVVLALLFIYFFFFFFFSGRSHSSQIKMWFRGFDSWMVSICIHLSGFSLNVSENTAEQR